MNNKNNNPAPSGGTNYITMLVGKRIPPFLCFRPMVNIQTIHALYGKGEPLDVWQKELIDGWVTVARKIGISQDPPVIRRAGKITHISLYMAFGASLLDTSFQCMIGRIPILEAAFGEHSAESLMRALNLCVALMPNANQQIDLRLLHEYLKLPEPFSLWSARAVKHLELESSLRVHAYDPARHLTEYSATMPCEDFAEIFHYYLRHRGRLPVRLINKPMIVKKWQFVAWMAKRISAS